MFYQGGRPRSGRVRVLVVSPWLPHAQIAHGGGHHLFHTVRSLTERGHAVFLVCYGRGESDLQAASLVEHRLDVGLRVPCHLDYGIQLKTIPKRCVPLH